MTEQKHIIWSSDPDYEDGGAIWRNSTPSFLSRNGWN